MTERHALPPTACPDCRNPDGTINAQWFRENAACLFGCGSQIVHDDVPAGICPKCEDHSANWTACETCYTEYEDWDGTPQVKTEASE